MKIRTTQLLSAAAVLAVSAGSASAAPITWADSVQMYPGSTVQTFVSTNGTGVLAMNGDTSTGGTFDVNGVTFTDVNGTTLNTTGFTQGGVTVTTSDDLPTYASFGDGSFSGDGDIFALIASAVYNPTTVTLTGLTIGQVYEIQIFTNDARNGRHSNFELGLSDGTQNFADSLTDGTAGRASLSNRNPADLTQGEPSGDYIIGTFTADATAQSFDTTGSTNGFASTSAGRAQINGLQLRDLGPVPEPGSLALMGLGGLLIARRRRNG